jgi:hypothetical protein
MFLLKKQNGWIVQQKNYTYTPFYVSNYYKEVLVVAWSGKVGLGARGIGGRSIDVNFLKNRV